MNLKEKFKEIYKKVEELFICYPYNELVVIKEDNECKEKLDVLTLENQNLKDYNSDLFKNINVLQNKVMALKGWLFFTNIFWVVLIIIFLFVKVFPYAS